MNGIHRTASERANPKETEIDEERTEHLTQSQKMSNTYRSINIMQNNTQFLSMRADIIVTLQYHIKTFIY